jgi:hypothetical protein
MSTAARKARKRAGEKFVRPEKVGTPPLERSKNAPALEEIMLRTEMRKMLTEARARLNMKEA